MSRRSISKFTARAGAACLLLTLVFLFLGRTVTEPCDSAFPHPCDANQTRWEWAIYAAGVALVLGVVLLIAAGFLAWRSRGESSSVGHRLSAGRGITVSEKGS
jgi:hypothetical protein